jgi:hypothetical protein
MRNAPAVQTPRDLTCLSACVRQHAGYSAEAAASAAKAGQAGRTRQASRECPALHYRGRSFRRRPGGQGFLRIPCPIREAGDL